MTQQQMDEITLTGRGPIGTTPGQPLTNHSQESRSRSALMLLLNERKRDLANLLGEYKENYPDVVMLRQEIEKLESRLVEGQITEAPPPPEGGGLAAPDHRGDALARPPLDLDLEQRRLSDLKSQIQEVEAESKRLSERERDLQRQIQVYERRVETAPSREQELAVLERDYENTKKNYQSLHDKKLNAKISENLEKKQKGEQFRILDPANLPEKPFKPDPMKIGLGGLVGGLGVGLALAFVRERLDGSIRKPDEVERITSVPVLASIPDFDEEWRFSEKKISRTMVHDGEADDEANHS